METALYSLGFRGLVFIFRGLVIGYRCGYQCTRNWASACKMATGIVGCVETPAATTLSKFHEHQKSLEIKFS